MAGFNVHLALSAPTYVSTARKVGAANKSIGASAKSASLSIGDLQRSAAQLLAVLGGARLLRSIVATDAAFKGLNATLRVATGSVDSASKTYQFLARESDRLGLNLAKTAQDFAKLSVAAKDTALQGAPIREVFLGVSEAATVMGLSSEQTRGTLFALEQMISKGRVSAEELRRQLGDRMPGAFKTAAAAIGVSTAELDKMLRMGELTAEELLPKLAARWRATFGSEAEEAAKRLQNQLNILGNAAFNLRVVMAEELAPSMSLVLREITKLFKDQSFVDFVRDATKGVGVLIQSLAPLVRALALVASKYHEFAAAVLEFSAQAIQAVQNFQRIFLNVVTGVARSALGLVASLEPVLPLLLKIANPSMDVGEFNRAVLRMAKGVSDLQRGFEGLETKGDIASAALSKMASEHLRLANEAKKSTDAAILFGDEAAGAGDDVDDATDAVVQLVRSFSEAENTLRGFLDELDALGKTKAQVEIDSVWESIDTLKEALKEITLSLEQAEEGTKAYSKLLDDQAHVAALLAETYENLDDIFALIENRQAAREQAARGHVEALEAEARAAQMGTVALEAYRREMERISILGDIREQLIEADITGEELESLMQRAGVALEDLWNAEEMNAQIDRWASYAEDVFVDVGQDLIDHVLGIDKIDDFWGYFEDLGKKILADVLGSFVQNLARRAGASLGNALTNAALGNGGGGGGILGSLATALVSQGAQQLVTGGTAAAGAAGTAAAGGATGAATGVATGSGAGQGLTAALSSPALWTGVAAVFTVAVIEILKSEWQKEQASRNFTNLDIFQANDGAFAGQIVSQAPNEYISGLEDSKEFTDALVEQLNMLIRGMGGTVEDFTGFRIRMRADGEEFIASLNGVETSFKDFNEAVRFSILSTLQDSDLGSLGKNMELLRANISPLSDSLEELAEGVAAAHRLDRTAGENPFEQVIEDILNDGRELFQTVSRWGLDMGDAAAVVQETLDGARQGIVDRLNALRGVDVSGFDAIRQLKLDVENWNAAARNAGESVQSLVDRAEDLGNTINKPDGLGNTGNRNEELADLGDNVGNLGDVADGASEIVTKLAGSMALAKDEAEELSIVAQEIDMEEAAEAIRMWVANTEASVLDTLGRLTGNSQALAQAEEIRFALELARVKILIAELEALGETEASLLAFMQGLADQAQNLLDTGQIPTGGTSVSVSRPSVDTGFQDRQRRRDDFFRELGELRLRLGGASEAAVSANSEFAAMRERLEALGRIGVADELLSEFLAGSLDLMRQDLLANAREIIRTATETALQTDIRHLAESYSGDLAAAFGIATEQASVLGTTVAEQFGGMSDVILQAFGVEAMGLVRSQIDALGDDAEGLRALLESLESVDLSEASQAVQDQWTELMAEIATQVSEASETVGDAGADTAAVLASVSGALSSLGLPAQQAQQAVSGARVAIEALNAALDAGAISLGMFQGQMSLVQATASLAFGDRLFGFLDRYYGTVQGFDEIRIQMERTRFNLEIANLRVQFEMLREMGALTDATITEIQNVLAFIDENPPVIQAPRPILPPGALGGGIGVSVSAPGQTLADVLADMQALISDWGGSSLNTWEQQIARLQEAADAMIERILEAGGNMSHAAPLLDALAVAIQGVKDSALDALRALRDELFFDDPTLSPREQLRRMEAQLRDLISASLAGDLEAQSQLPAAITAIRQLLLQSFGAGSDEFDRINAMINAVMESLLGPNPNLSLLPPPGSGSPFEPGGGSLPPPAPGSTETRLGAPSSAGSQEVVMLHRAIERLADTVERQERTLADLASETSRYRHDTLR